MTLYLLATADVQPDPALCLLIVVFYVYVAWLLLTSGGAE